MGCELSLSHDTVENTEKNYNETVRDYINETNPEKYGDSYYHAFQDLEQYPDLGVLFTFSRRGPGKTYSFLLGCIRRGICCAYIKRTIKDVDLICMSDKGLDLSPYSPINRDYNLSIHCIKVTSGIAEVWYCDEVIDEKTKKVTYVPKQDSECLGYILAANIAKSTKGLDFSKVDLVCFDEIIPVPGEVVKHNEAGAFMNTVYTIRRDRVKRGRQDLKLLLFANSEDIACPMTIGLDLIDPVYDLYTSGYNKTYIEKRRLLLHWITEDEIPLTEDDIGALGAFLQGTSLYDKIYGGEFSTNDFTNIKKMSVKYFKTLARCCYEKKIFYILYRDSDGMFYVSSKANGVTKNIISFNFNRRAEINFYIEGKIRQRLLDSFKVDKVFFEKYSYYDILINLYKYV